MNLLDFFFNVGTISDSCNVYIQLPFSSVVVTAKITILIKTKADEFHECLSMFLKVMGGAKSKTNWLGMLA